MRYPPTSCWARTGFRGAYECWTRSTFEISRRKAIMKIAAKFSFLILSAAWLPAQAPPHGGGPGGFGPRFDTMSVGPGSKTPVLGAPYSAVQTSQMQQTLAGQRDFTAGAVEGVSR